MLQIGHPECHKAPFAASLRTVTRSEPVWDAADGGRPEPILLHPFQRLLLSNRWVKTSQSFRSRARRAHPAAYYGRRKPPR